MNIRWDTQECVFVAEFSQNFAGDLEACKAAGFRPLGIPPPWIWHAPAPGVAALNRLRANRPASGLTISQEALAIYQPLAERQAKNDEVRKQLTDAKKVAKKQRKQKEQLSDTSESFSGLTEEKWWIGAEDLPPWVSLMPPKIKLPKDPNEKICEGCGGPLCQLDYPDLCLWCSKTNVLEDLF